MRPEATLIGVDSSPAMLDDAARALPNCRFVAADIRQYQPERPADLLYANASLQWLTDHETLFPQLVNRLADNGLLAVQMPDNWQEPSHTLMRQVAQNGVPGERTSSAPGAQAYYDILTACGCEVDIWRTTYYHPLESHRAIIDWLQSTGLRLPATARRRAAGGFLNRYLTLLQQHYPLQCNGRFCSVPAPVYRRAHSSYLMTETPGDIAVTGRQRRFGCCHDRLLALRVLLIDRQLIRRRGCVTGKDGAPEIPRGGQQRKKHNQVNGGLDTFSIFDSPELFSAARRR